MIKIVKAVQALLAVALLPSSGCAVAEPITRSPYRLASDSEDEGCRRMLTRCVVIKDQIVCESIEDKCDSERWLGQ